MLTKEKFLKDKISLHLKSPESNEEYVKLIQRLIDLGWKTYDNTSAENFSQYTWIYLPHIDEEYFEIHHRNNPDGQKEIQVSDIIGTQFEVGKWWLNLKLGDKIKCTEVEQKNYSGNIYGGAGWKSNEIFTVRKVDDYKDYGIIFIEEHNQQGIHTTSCTIYSKVKPLTVYDLVEGEIYYCLDNTICLWGKKDSTHLINPKIKDFWNAKPGRYNNTYGFRLATPEEKHWLNVCISENKFIEKEVALRGYDIYGKVLKSEVTKPVNKSFEFNKWYKSNNANGLFFIQSKNTGYGFRSNYVNYWFTNNADFEWNIDGLAPATNEEVQERLLRYAKEKYPVGTKFKSIVEDKNYIVDGTPINWVSSDWPDGIGNFGFGMLYGKGQWADVISKPETKESKEMQLSDLKNPVFNIGDKVRVIADSLREFNSSWSNGNNAKYKKGYEGLITEIEKTKSGSKAVNTWYYLEDTSNAISCNLLELVEPVKKEFDRDWYVEVNSQEEADKVFDWLESQDEKIGEKYYRKFRKGIDKYLYYFNEGKFWAVNSSSKILSSKLKQKQLSDILPGYTQSKPGLWNQIDSKYVFPVESIEIKLAELEQTSKPMPKIEKVKVQLISVPRI